MSSVGSYEAKTHLPELLRRAEAGERITITRRGRPIARLVPYEESETRTAAEAVAALREFREGRRLGSDLAELERGEAIVPALWLLEVASRLGVPLATLDGALRSAAAAEGVEILD